MEKRLREWIEKEREKLKRKREESDYLPERYYLWGRLEALDSLEDWLKKNLEKNTEK